MGQFHPKPYKKLCRETGKWVLVIPEPVEFNQKSFNKKEYSEDEKKGSKRHPHSYTVLKYEAPSK